MAFATAAIASASDVASLTKETFPDFVKENDLALLECKFFLAQYSYLLWITH